MEHGGEAAMGGELKNEVQAAVGAESDQLSSVGVINVSYDTKLRQEITNPILIVHLFLQDLLHCHNLAIW